MSAFCIPVFTQFTALKGFGAPINKCGSVIFLLMAEKAPKPWAKISLILVPAQHRPWRPDTWKMTPIHERKIHCGTTSLTAEA